MRIIIKGFLVGTLLIPLLVSSGDQTSAQGDGAPKPPVPCTLEYLPVCAVKHRTAKTYANACNAKAVGARIVARGPCKQVK
jgi:hypothetical protein